MTDDGPRQVIESPLYERLTLLVSVNMRRRSTLHGCGWTAVFQLVLTNSC
jgi:hypothetical protein